jgi:hypothetical protein
MGSGYKNFTAASVLTAADLNNYCQSQSVMYFPTIAGAGGRDTVITAPVDGMVAYIGSNDADEGLYTYNGTSWRKGPGWNAPWGLIARNQGNGSGTATSGTTETAIFTSASFTAVANRYYRVNISTSINATAGDTYTLRVRQDSTSGTVWWNGNAIYGTGVTTLLIHPMGSNTLTAGSHTFVLTATRSAGSGNASIGTLVLVNMTVEDLGPSGAPV